MAYQSDARQADNKQLTTEPSRERVSPISASSFVDRRASTDANTQLKAKINASPRHASAQALQRLVAGQVEEASACDVVPALRAKATLQAKGLALDPGNKQHAPVQRRVIGVTDGDEERKLAHAKRIEGIKATGSGAGLFSEISDHKKTCLFDFSQNRNATFTAGFASAEEKKRGADVSVLIPDGDVMELGDNKGYMIEPSAVAPGGGGGMSAVEKANNVSSIHEMIHAKALLDETHTPIGDELHHEVWEKVEHGPAKLLRRELIPEEEILTVGFKDTDKYFHKYFDINGEEKKGPAQAPRAINENSIRAQVGAGTRHSYVVTPLLADTKTVKMAKLSAAKMEEDNSAMNVAVGQVRQRVAVLIKVPDPKVPDSKSPAPAMQAADKEVDRLVKESDVLEEERKAFDVKIEHYKELKMTSDVGLLAVNYPAWYAKVKRITEEAKALLAQVNVEATVSAPPKASAIPAATSASTSDSTAGEDAGSAINFMDYL